MDEIRDIGKDSPLSMKDGFIFTGRDQFILFSIMTFFSSYHYHYIVSPRRYKVHRSMHSTMLFGISVYLPYRYSDHINTVLFTLSKSSNPYVNMIVRAPSKVLIYGASIFIGQLIARLYWTYKRSLNATRKAVLETYIQNKKYSNKGPFLEKAAFDEVRPKLVT